MVDLKPKRGRVDAIQSFASQETPIVRITNADGRQSILAGSESADPGNDRLRTLPCAFSADARGAAGRTVAGGASLERVKGIEPSYSAWKADSLKFLGVSNRFQSVNYVGSLLRFIAIWVTED
jgi:hypothetical protein